MSGEVWETLAWPIFYPAGFSGSPERERENLGGTPPNHCLTLPAQPRPEAQPGSDFTQAVSIRAEQGTHQYLSSHLRAGRREERGEGKSQRRPGDGVSGGPGVQATEPGSGYRGPTMWDRDGTGAQNGNRPGF